jgi:hypothetical protein
MTHVQLCACTYHRPLAHYWTLRTMHPARLQYPSRCRSSIHMREAAKDELNKARQGIPIPVPECPGVYHCGFHAAKSFSATSYLIVREGDEGNVMMDSPRFNPLLAKQITALGGVKYIVLSHMCAPCLCPASIAFRSMCRLLRQAPLTMPSNVLLSELFVRIQARESLLSSTG